MAGVYTTSRGKQIDINQIKIKNEMVVAVGNAGTNARGDLVKGGKIVKTREEVMRDQYNIRGNNIPKNDPIRESMAHVEADVVAIAAPLDFESPLHELTSSELPTTDITPDPLANAPRGGLASAVSKSQEIADILEQQRKRI
jgi:hypothetical protein